MAYNAPDSTSKLRKHTCVSIPDSGSYAICAVPSLRFDIIAVMNFFCDGDGIAVAFGECIG